MPREKEAWALPNKAWRPYLTDYEPPIERENNSMPSARAGRMSAAKLLDQNRIVNHAAWTMWVQWSRKNTEAEIDMNRRPFFILGLLLCLPAFAAPQGDSGPPADILAVRNIEIIFHTAGSVLPTKDLELMMSLYADDAVLTDTAHDNKVYQGKEQVRTYWANVSGPFRPEHHWIGYTPAMRIKSNVTGNTGTLDFECLWMNVDDNTIGAHAFSSMEVARVKGHWLVKRIKVGKVDKL